MKFEENLELWSTEVPKTIPHQSNGYDCGMCLCLNMESLSRLPKVEEIKYTDS
jgi:Ulp1 family protease